MAVALRDSVAVEARSNVALVTRALNLLPPHLLTLSLKGRHSAYNETSKPPHRADRLRSILPSTDRFDAR
jgi:hypothetical protein